MVLRNELARFRGDLNVQIGEIPVSGALRIANADLMEFSPLDGLRLAVEMKPVNLAVGKAIWNRFGDIRTFAVNLHLKFPFAIVGGVLTVPTWETVPRSAKWPNGRRTTGHIIDRAIRRLMRSGGRENEGDAPHLLEGIAVLVYDPTTGLIDPDIPAPDSGLRWTEFVENLLSAFDARFEGQAGPAANHEDEI